MPSDWFWKQTMWPRVLLVLSTELNMINEIQFDRCVKMVYLPDAVVLVLCHSLGSFLSAGCFAAETHIVECALNNFFSLYTPMPIYEEHVVFRRGAEETLSVCYSSTATRVRCKVKQILTIQQSESTNWKKL